MSSPEIPPGERLNQLLAASGIDPLDPLLRARFETYLSLILRWNSRTNLTAVRDPGQILSRHFVESIACAQALPPGISTLLDFGSGAGFPGIPIALCRLEISVTLAESQGKKAAFLQEALRTLGLSARVHPARAESLPPIFDAVVLRAVDKMPHAVASAARLLAGAGCLVLLTTTAALAELHSAAGPAFIWSAPVALPGSDRRILSLGRKISSPS